MRRIPRGLGLALILTVISATMAPAPALSASKQNDAGSRRDAGNTFEDATKVTPSGGYKGRLDADNGDVQDFYRFTLPKDGFVSILIQFEAPTVDPIRVLDPNGVPIDVGLKAQGVGVTASQGMTSEVGAVRVAVHRAVMAGDYRLQLSAERNTQLGEYSLCFMNCEPTVDAPIQLIFGGSLETVDARVLLVPPSHGDLGNPLGPTVVDYLEATFRGIDRWEEALDAFAKDYPKYGYLKDISVKVEVFDEADPVDPVGYDVILGYVAAGPAFRGVAGDFGTKDMVKSVLRQVGLEEETRYSGRVIALSLFGSAPRAGQVMWDFPEVNDLEVVTTHEFGHTFGLGHTTTWHPKLGPDLMNSPAPFVYGDGQTIGDGGERTKMKCLSSLDLYGMAYLYRWVPDGKWLSSDGETDMPKGMPYEWYC